MSFISGSELKESDEVHDCQWFLREKVFENKEWTGKYTGRVYCLYTCSETIKNQKKKFVDVSCCPHLSEIDNPCQLLEQARSLEGYYITHNYKIIPEPKQEVPKIKHDDHTLQELKRLLQDDE